MKREYKFLILLFLINTVSFAKPKSFTANVMAPNLVGQTSDVQKNRDQWAKFEIDLEKMKSLGIQSISTHIWWSLAEPKDNQFDWTYYNKLSEIIIDKGLKWSPIISFHSCQTKKENCNIKIPSWVWSKYQNSDGIENEADLKFVSTNGTINDEYISFWATDIVAIEYKEFIQSFIKNFNKLGSKISEIIISLGPNGELRYPISELTLNQPQAYSQLAKKSFRSFVKSKYKTVDNVNSSWNVDLKGISDIQPPLEQNFFINEEYKSTFGKDFYDWYNRSLTEHGIIVLTTVIREFNKEGSNFINTPIGTIIPGSIWRSDNGTDRTAELNAGLIRSSDNFWDKENKASGYEHIISSLKEASTLTKFEKLNIHLTAIEMTAPKEMKLDDDSQKSLAFEISNLASSMNLGIMGQNQSVNVLGSNQAWDNIWNAVQNGNYSGLTIKTMNDISENPLAYDFYKWIIENMNE